MDLPPIVVNLSKIPGVWKDSRPLEYSSSGPDLQKGSRNKPRNYRLVSLTSVQYKILKSRVRDSIMAHLQYFHLLDDALHGFVPRRSCASQLLSCTEDWTQAIEEGHPVDLAYLDF